MASIDYAELAADYWAEIGVEVEIDVLTNAEYHDRLFSGTHEGMASANAGMRNWQLWLANPIQYNAHQPWVRGYNGETSLGPENSTVILARLWIDQQLKKEMGF